MKLYSVDIEVTTRWTVEIHASDGDEAWEIAEGMEFDEIEDSADFKELQSVEVINVEEITNDDNDD